MQNSLRSESRYHTKPGSCSAAGDSYKERSKTEAGQKGCLLEAWSYLRAWGHKLVYC